VVETAKNKKMKVNNYFYINDIFIYF